MTRESEILNDIFATIKADSKRGKYLKDNTEYLGVTPEEVIELDGDYIYIAYIPFSPVFYGDLKNGGYFEGSLGKYGFEDFDLILDNNDHIIYPRTIAVQVTTPSGYIYDEYDDVVYDADWNVICENIHYLEDDTILNEIESTLKLAYNEVDNSVNAYNYYLDYVSEL